MSLRVDRRTIIVGADDSPTASNAARWAAYLADALRAPLLIICATGDSDSPSPARQLAALVHPSRSFESARDTVERIVALVRTTGPQASVGTALIPGAPARVLVKASQHARIVVVGGQSAFESRMTGPTTVRVVERAQCPVAVWRGANGRPIPRRKPVAVGVDGSALSIPALAHGFDIAAALDVPLVAVHSWPSRIATVGDHLERGERERLLLAECLAGWREQYPDVEVTELPVPGLVTPVLTEIADQVQLLVVGSRGRGTATAALLGSTSRDLLHHASCPVLVCHDERR